MLPATLRAAGATLDSCSITISGSDTGDLRPSCCTAHAARRRRMAARFFRMKLSLQVLERLLRRGGLFAVWLDLEVLHQVLLRLGHLAHADVDHAELVVRRPELVVRLDRLLQQRLGLGVLARVEKLHGV